MNDEKRHQEIKRIEELRKKKKNLKGKRKAEEKKNWN